MKIGTAVFWGERLLSRISQLIVISGGLVWLKQNKVQWFYYPLIGIAGLLMLWIEYRFIIRSHGNEWKKYYGNLSTDEKKTR